MRGAIEYTLHTVAFQNVEQRDREVDDLSVSVEGRGSIRFSWLRLGRDEPSVRVEAFWDGMAALLDARVRAVLAVVQGEGGASPERVVELLDQQGADPSHYHLRGLAERATTLDEKAALQARYEAAKAKEDAR